MVGATRPTAATADTIIAFRNISFSIQDLAPSTNPQMATVLEHCDEHRHNDGSTRRESVVNCGGRPGSIPPAQFVLHAVSAKARLEKAEASLNVIASGLKARVRNAR
jgi:hypothetical protein